MANVEVVEQTLLAAYLPAKCLVGDIMEYKSGAFSEATETHTIAIASLPLNLLGWIQATCTTLQYYKC